jgi:hypothetical protein
MQVTPTDAEIVQGSPSSPKRPEADRVSAIVEILSPPAYEAEGDYESGRRAGMNQALNARGQNDSFPMGGPDDQGWKDYQRGSEDGRKTIEELFKE